MTKEEKLDILCDEQITRDYITAKDLTNLGISYRDIKYFIDNDKIIRVKRGIYIFVDEYLLIKKSFEYGSNHEYDKAESFIKRACILNNYDPDYIYILLIYSLLNKDYNTYIKGCNKLEKIGLQEEANYFLILLNACLELPEEIRDKIENISLDSIMSDFGDNEVRKKAFYNYFEDALNCQNNNIVKNDTYNWATRTLLIYMKNKKYQYINSIIKELKEGNYKLAREKIKENVFPELDEFLTEAELLLNLLDKEIKSNSRPTSINIYTHNYRHAIAVRNYELALELRKEYDMRYGYKTQRDIIYNILECINKELSNKSYMTNDIKKIIDYFNNEDIESAFKELNKFLQKESNKKYKRLFDSLYILCERNNDTRYSLICDVLTYLNNNERLDNGAFIHGIHKSIISGEYSNARRYLKIVYELDKIEKNGFMFSEPLGKTVELSDNIGYLQSIFESDNLIEEELKIKLLSITKDLVLNRGAAIVGEFNDEEIKYLTDIFYKSSNIKPIIIGDTNTQKLVLRYCTRKPLDYKKIQKDAETNKYQLDIEAALNNYLDICSFNYFKVKTYYNLALCYTYLGDSKKANNYLEIYNGLSDNKKDCNDINKSIQELIKTSEEKPTNINMTEEVFFGEVFTTDSFNEISAYIEASNLDFESACKSLGMSEEKILLLKCEYAKKYFEQHMEQVGDEFLQSVSKNLPTGSPVISARKEVEKNKKLYLKKSLPEKQISIISLKKEQ